MSDKPKTKEEREEEKRLKAHDREVMEANARDQLKYNLTQHYIRDAEHILASAQDQPDFLIEGAITRRSLFMFQGDPESLKSWLAYDLAIAGAQQREWLDFEPPEKAFSTLILNYDNAEWELGRRLKRLGMKPTDKIKAHSLGDELPPGDLPALLQFPESLEAVLLITDQLKPDLIIVDSLRQCHLGEEESSSDAMRLMAAFKAISAAGHGSTIIALHHLRKPMQQRRRRGAVPATQEARGSTEFIASLDGSITVTREKEKEKKDIKLAVAAWGKTRTWNPPEPIERAFRVIDDGAETFVENTSTNFSFLLKVLREGPLSKTELCKDLSMDLRQLSRLIGRAKAAGLVQDAPRRTENSTRKIQLAQKK